jgi:NADP-reducing hydrogenase subunit HndC
VRAHAHALTHEPSAVFEVRVCTGSGCMANGSLEIAETFENAIAEAGAEARFRIVKTGCHGLCAQGPVVVVGADGVFYPAVDAVAARQIAASILDGGAPVDSLLYRDDADAAPIPAYDDVPFNARQHRIVLRNCGIIDPENLDDALEVGAYEGLRHVLGGMTPDGVIEER